MPNQAEIKQLAQELGPPVVLGECLQKLHRIVRKDVILYAADFVAPPEVSDGVLAINDKDIQHLMHTISEMGDGSRTKKRKGGQAKRRNLDLILHSSGGSLAAAEQIVHYLRAKYTHIRVIVPQNAMSAATMIACAANEVMMGRHSALGPTDPQIDFESGMVAAQSILNEFDIAEGSSSFAQNIIAEKIKEWPPGLIDECLNAIKLADTVVADWLCRHMKLSPDKAKEVAEKLADVNANLTHGRPFNYDKLEGWGLKVRRLEDSQTLQDAVLSVFYAANEVFERGAVKIVVNHHGKGVFEGPDGTKEYITE